MLMNKQTVKQILAEGFRLMRQDLKDYKWMLILLAAYFGTIWKFFHTSCFLVEVTGFPCPACGMTRAGFAVLHGNFSSAWYLHPFIYPIICLTAAAVIKRYFLKQGLMSLKKWLILILALMVVFYVYRMIFCFPGDPPMSYYRNNLLRNIFSLYRNR